MFRNIFKPLAFWCSIGIAAAVVLGLYVMPVILIYSEDLPDYNQLKNYNPPSISRIYSYDGSKIAELSAERRIYENFEDIPDLVIKAFLSAEDQNYYFHPGVDIFSIGRAAIQNFANKGTDKNPVGGSTITQQVVKNFLLTNERTLSRKIKEAILAYRINKVYSKDKILELYLNQIYLGNGSYGIKAAAIDYFNKDLHQLDIHEVALLAALPKAPSHLDPFRHPIRAKQRRDWVISRMQEDGFITNNQALAAKNADIKLHPKQANSEYKQTYYSEAVRLEVMEKFGKDALYEKGLTIHTNLVPELQKIADEALQKGLIDYDRRHGYKGPIGNYKFQNNKEWLEGLKLQGKFTAVEGWQYAICLGVNQHTVTIGLENGKKGLITLKDLSWARKRLKDNFVGSKITSPMQVLKKGDIILVSKKKGKNNEYFLEQIPDANGALVAIQPHTGKVLALSGGFSFTLSHYNRAIQAQRQPGSTFKAFVYLAALEQGYSPLSVVKDEPLVISQGEGKPDWTPKNYSGNFMGPITMRTALEKSRNLATIRVLMAAGVEKVANISERFGVYENPPHLLSMALGAHETTPLKIVSGYASIASNGIEIKPSLINRINDINGHLIYSTDHRKCIGCTEESGSNLSSFAIPKLENNARRIINPQTNYQLLSMLTGVVERGTGRRAKVVGKTLAGKTGTSNKSNDTWFIGFSPDIVAGVYIGYDNPKTLGNYENGAVTALPVFANFMKKALKNIDDKQFPIPDGVEIIEIDKDTGQPVNIFTEPANRIKESLKEREIDNYKEILEEQIESRINEEIVDDTFYSNQADEISGVY